MKIRADDLLPGTLPETSIADLDSALSLTVDEALKIALSKSANKKLEPIWYEKILSKLGDKEKETFTLGLASSGIEVTSATGEAPAPVARKADLDLESCISKIKNHIQKLVSDKGFITEDDYNEALFGKDAHEEAPGKVVGEINAWLMQSMIPLKKNKPRKGISKGYEKKVKDQVKNPDVKKFIASSGGMRISASEIIKTKVRAGDVLEKRADIRLSPKDKKVINSFIEHNPDESKLLYTDGETLDILGFGGSGIALWHNGKIKVRDLGTRSEQTVVHYLMYVTPKVLWGGWLQDEEDALKKKSWKELPKEDFDAIKSFLHKKPASGDSVESDGEFLKVQTDHHEKTLARWKGDRLTTEPPETQFEDVVLSWLFRWEPKHALKKPEHALSLSQEKEELSQAIESWEPKLPNFKDWAKRVMKAENFSDLRELWDELWAMKEDQSVELHPSDHEFREYVDMKAHMEKRSIQDPALIEEVKMIRDMLGSDQLLDEFLDHASDEEIDALLEEVIQTQGMPEPQRGPGVGKTTARDASNVIARWESKGGKHWIEVYKDARGYFYREPNGGGTLFSFISDDEAVQKMESILGKTPLKRVMRLLNADDTTTDTNNFEEAYDAVGGDPQKITDWLKSNKGADPVKNPQLKNTVTNWLSKSKNIKAPTNTTTPVGARLRLARQKRLGQITDRYDALGIPHSDPKTMCRGGCEGTGYIPIHAEEARPSLKKLWDEEEEKEHAEDGWHFVRCPDCKGTGKILVASGKKAYAESTLDAFLQELDREQLWTVLDDLYELAPNPDEDFERYKDSTTAELRSELRYGALKKFKTEDAAMDWLFPEWRQYDFDISLAEEPELMNRELRI